MERKAFLIAALGVFSVAPAISNADVSTKCAGRTDLAGPCYQVHGRLNAWNGYATERIWVIGTKRMLAVAKPGAGEELMPKRLDDQLGSFWTRIYADFTVCPFDKDVPKRMRHVCIDSAKNILVERHADPDGKDKGRFTKIPDISSE